MTKINITIPKPCHENWQTMTPEDKGRFCDSCQKKVFDFTASSDREIINAFEKNKNFCGRFLDTQLDRDLVKPKEKSTLWLATTTALISLVSMNEATSQEKVPTEQTDQRILGKFIASHSKEEIEISGVITDRTGPLPGATISIKGKPTQVQSDFDGKYTIKAEQGETLIITFIGYEDVQFKIEKSNEINNLELKRTFSLRMENVFLGFPEIKKRTFFGSIFHSIGNWFR